MFKAVIYVESPLQALNAMEYLYAEGLLNSFKYTFIINENKRVSKNNVAQIQHTISEFNLLHVNIIYINGNFFRFWNSIKLDALRVIFHVYWLKYDLLILGEYRSFLGRIIALKFKFNGNCVLVDDGTATLKLKPKDVIHGVTYFTLFGESLRKAGVKKILKNNFLWIRQKIQKLPMQDDKVFIIGQPFLEIGDLKNSIAEDQMLSALEQFLKLHFSNKNLVYIPHRREKKSKLSKIAKFCKIEEFGYPFELYPLIEMKLPKYLVCFTSTVVVTYAQLSPKTEVHAIKLHEDLLSQKAKYFHELIYDLFRNLDTVKLIIFK
ncbi:hypothetical protein N9R24_00035 [Amylibacter sp.]|nr:hypothetical protein [Amylibacter sp.]